MSHRAPFDAYVAPARARPQLWRLILGLVLATLVYLAVLFAIGAAYWRVVGDARMQGALGGLASGGTPETLVVLLLTFTGMALGAMAAARVLHGRGPGTLFGPARRVAGDFLRVSALAAGVFGAGLLALPDLQALIPGVPLEVWLLALPFALVGLLIQTGAEELLFRGYIQQQLAARFATPLAWMIVPSLAFGLVHYDPGTMGANAWLIVAATGLFGLIAADLTARTGSIGAAWGLHFVNNVFALLLVTMGGGLDGLALYRLPGPGPAETDLVPLLAFDIALLGVVWLGARRWLRRD